MKFRYQRLPLPGHQSGNPLVARPMLPVFLVWQGRRTPSPAFALLDSGADRVIFPAEFAGHLGIESIESGVREAAVGIAGQRAEVFYHSLGVEVLGGPSAFLTEVGFSRAILLPILGRTFFVHFSRVVFSERDEELELEL